MEPWLDWARGPMFRIALAFCLLGLLRSLALALLDLGLAVHKAGDKNIPYRKLARATLGWLVPARKMGHRPIYSATTAVMHVSVLLVPLLLAGHIALWAAATGLSWPAIPNLLADVLTLVAVAAGVLSIVQRVSVGGRRAISRLGDYAFPAIIVIVFGSGFLAMHPALSPVPFEPMLLVHIVCANLVLILIPFTKLAHVVLMPAGRVISEVAWHFPPNAGHEVGVALGKENEPI